MLQPTSDHACCGTFNTGRRIIDICCLGATFPGCGQGSTLLRTPPPSMRNGHGNRGWSVSITRPVTMNMSSSHERPAATSSLAKISIDHEAASMTCIERITRPRVVAADKHTSTDFQPHRAAISGNRSRYSLSQFCGQFASLLLCFRGMQRSKFCKHSYAAHPMVSVLINRTRPGSSRKEAHLAFSDIQHIKYPSAFPIHHRHALLPSQVNL